MTEAINHPDITSHLGGLIKRFEQADHNSFDAVHSRNELLMQLSPEELTDALNVPDQFEQYDGLLLPVNRIAGKQSKAAQELGEAGEAQKFVSVRKRAGELLLQSIGTTEEEAEQYTRSQQPAATLINRTVEDMVAECAHASDELEETRGEIFDTLRLFDPAELHYAAAHATTGEPDLDETLHQYIELTARRQAKAAADIGDEDGRISYALVQADASDRVPLLHKYNVTGRIV